MIDVRVTCAWRARSGIPVESDRWRRDSSRRMNRDKFPTPEDSADAWGLCIQFYISFNFQEFHPHALPSQLSGRAFFIEIFRQFSASVDDRRPLLTRTESGMGQAAGVGENSLRRRWREALSKTQPLCHASVTNLSWFRITKENKENDKERRKENPALCGSSARPRISLYKHWALILGFNIRKASKSAYICSHCRLWGRSAAANYLDPIACRGREGQSLAFFLNQGALVSLECPLTWIIAPFFSRFDIRYFVRGQTY